jgi:hypothetical protein
MLSVCHIYGKDDSNLAQSEPTQITFNGYRTPIDEYYSAVLHGEEATLPKQEMPARLAEIITSSELLLNVDAPKSSHSFSIQVGRTARPSRMQSNDKSAITLRCSE